MAKRILCLLLTVMLVLSVFAVVPAYAEGEEATTPTRPNSYSYKFEDVDARNYVDGQVLDLGYKGEAAEAPSLTGDLSEYQATQTFISNSGHDPITTYISIKDGYLYIAFEATELRYAQYDLGVAGSHRSDSIRNRLRLVKNVDGTDNNQLPFIYKPGTATNIADKQTKLVASHFISVTYTNGVQEAKINLVNVYKFFGSLGDIGQEVDDSPCLSFALHLIDGEDAGAYAVAFPSEVTTVDSEKNMDSIPATIILSQKTFNDMRAKMGYVGEMGTDHRNMIDGQLLRLTEEAKTAPTLNGVIATGEYQDSIQDGAQSVHFAVKDGYLYMATSYTNASGYQSGANFWVNLKYSLANHMEHNSLNGVSFAERETRSQYFGLSNSTGAYQTNARNLYGWNANPAFTSAGYEPSAIVDRKWGFGDNVVMEWKFSIAILAVTYEGMGWSAYSANAFQFKLAENFRAYECVPSNQPTSSGAERAYTCIATGWLTTWTTVELPEGYVAKYVVNGTDDLATYGQKTVDAALADVELDGKISAGEYGPAYNYTAGTISGSTAFAYDDEYVYVAGTFVDPHFIAGFTQYDAKFGVVKDKVDVTGAYNDVLTISLRADASGRLFLNPADASNKPSIRIRDQKYYTVTAGAAGSYTDRQTAILAAIPTYEDGPYAVVGKYDENTKTVTFELKVPFSVLKTAFEVDSIGDLAYYENFNYSADSTENYSTAATSFGINSVAAGGNGAYKALQFMTMEDWGISKLNIGGSDTVGHVVNLGTDMKTKDAASVRLSNAYEASGLRFKTSFDADFLANLKAYAEANSLTFEFGTIIAPNNYVETAGEFTIEALDKLDLGDKAAYVKVAANYDNPFTEKNGVKTYAGSLANIKTTNLDRDFAGIGYVQVGDMVIYSSDYTVRSVAQVAQSALDAGEFSNNAAAVEILNKLAGNN